MKELMKRLKALVEEYAIYSADDNAYHDKRPLSKQEKQKIDASLISLFSHFLVQEGADARNLDGQANQLKKIFHPEKLQHALPEITWLESTLSNGQPDESAIFQVLIFCVNSLKNTSDEAKPKYAQFQVMEELISSLEKQRETALTMTQRALIDSLLSLLNSVGDYHSLVGEKKIPWLTAFMHSMPYISSSICIGFFANELGLLFGATYLISKGGKWLERSSKGRWEILGQQMQAISSVLLLAGTTLMARMVELNFFLLKNVSYVGIEASHSIYSLMAAPPKKVLATAPVDSSVSYSQNTCTDLILMPQDLLGGKRFSHLEMKFIAKPLEDYKEVQQTQWFANMRTGSTKNSLLQNAVLQLQLIDNNSQALPDKLRQTLIVLNRLQAHRLFKTRSGESWDAIRSAQLIYQGLAGERLPVKETKMLMIEDGSQCSFFKKTSTEQSDDVVAELPSALTT